MDLPLWGFMCNEFLLRFSCNHFAVTAERGPCVVDTLAGRSLSVCVCIYICVFICIYIVTFMPSQVRVRRSKIVLTQTRRVSSYPRLVIKDSDFLADYSLLVTCLGS
jgi:hypothetical protein